MKKRTFARVLGMISAVSMVLSPMAAYAGEVFEELLPASLTQAEADVAGDTASASANVTVTVDFDAATKLFFDKNGPAAGCDGSSFTIDGNYNHTKGVVNYNGTLYTNYLKMESATSVSFKTAEDCKLLLVMYNSDVADKDVTKRPNIKIDGSTVSFTDWYLIKDLKAGEHTLTKKDSWNLYYLGLTSGAAAGSGSGGGSGSGNPVVGEGQEEYKLTASEVVAAQGITEASDSSTALPEEIVSGLFTISKGSLPSKTLDYIGLSNNSGKVTFSAPSEGILTVVVRSAGEDKTSNFKLRDSKETVIPEKSGATTVSGKNDTTLTFDIPAAGTYIFGYDQDAAKADQLRFRSISLIAAAGAVEDMTGKDTYTFDSAAYIKDVCGYASKEANVAGEDIKDGYTSGIYLFNKCNVPKSQVDFIALNNPSGSVTFKAPSEGTLKISARSAGEGSTTYFAVKDSKGSVIAEKGGAVSVSGKEASALSFAIPAAGLYTIGYDEAQKSDAFRIFSISLIAAKGAEDITSKDLSGEGGQEGNTDTPTPAASGAVSENRALGDQTVSVEYLKDVQYCGKKTELGDKLLIGGVTAGKEIPGAKMVFSKVKYKNNKALGTAEAYVTLKAAKGADSKVKDAVKKANQEFKSNPIKFNIVPRDITGMKIGGSASYKSKSKKLSAKLTLTLEGAAKPLKLKYSKTEAKSDFIVDAGYAGGTALTITGRGNYTGTAVFEGVTVK